MKYKLGQKFYCVHMYAYLSIIFVRKVHGSYKYELMVNDDPDDVGELSEDNLTMSILDGSIIEHSTTIKPLMYVKRLNIV